MLFRSQQKYEVFEKLIEKQLSFFWRPEEIDVSRDCIDYANLPEHEKHIFISNLKYPRISWPCSSRISAVTGPERAARSPRAPAASSADELP